MNHLIHLSDEKYKISAFKRRVNHPCTTSRSKVIFTFVPKITPLVSYIQMHHVSKCRKISRRRMSMVDSAYESWWFIFLSSEKILVIRTHTQELHVVKCAPNTQISAHFGPHWGQHNYVGKVLPKVTGVFLWLSKTKSMTFWCSKNVSNILVGWFIHSILWGQPKKIA